MGRAVPAPSGPAPAGRASDAITHDNLCIINCLLILAGGIPVLHRTRSQGVKVPANGSGERVNLPGYLIAGRRALPGFARSVPGSIGPGSIGPGASIGIGEQQVPILIAPAGGAVHGSVAFGGGDDFIQPEETHQEDSHEGDRNQEVPPAGLQDGILHDRLQDAAVLISSVYWVIAQN